MDNAECRVKNAELWCETYGFVFNEIQRISIHVGYNNSWITSNS